MIKGGKGTRERSTTKREEIRTISMLEHAIFMFCVLPWKLSA